MTSAEHWVQRADVTARLEAEATSIAKRLGHILCSWLDIGHDRRSRCIRCYGAAVIRVRQFAGAPLGGEALNLRCKGRP